MAAPWPCVVEVRLPQVPAGTGRMMEYTWPGLARLIGDKLAGFSGSNNTRLYRHRTDRSSLDEQRTSTYDDSSFDRHRFDWSCDMNQSTNHLIYIAHTYNTIPKQRLSNIASGKLLNKNKVLKLSRSVDGWRQISTRVESSFSPFVHFNVC